MFVSSVPSFLSVAMMSAANLPLASSSVVATLYSFLRANGISATLIAGLPIRSMFTQRPVPVMVPSLRRIWRCRREVDAATPITLPAEPRSSTAGMRRAIACTL